MFPPYLFAYIETLRAEPAIGTLRKLAKEQGADLWLTGGSLRDALLTRWPKDLDLAVKGNVEKLAKSLARKVRGAYVPLDPSTGTARVAINSTQGINWIDLVALRAPTIAEDLAARDFTINAIGLAFEEAMETASGDFIDPTGGRDDLHGQRIRMTSANAFAEDPLRMVRAYRFAAQLGFTMTPETSKEIVRQAENVTRPAAERVAQEMSSLFASPAPSGAVAQMMADGVLDRLMPELGAMRGVTQNDYHHLDVWDHTVEAMRQMEQVIAAPPHAVGDRATRFVNDEKNREMLYWSALFHDVGKPPCRTEEAGRVRFIGHDQTGREMALAAMERLRLPGKICRRVGRLVRNHLRPLGLAPVCAEGKLSGRAVDHLHRDLKDDLPALFLLAMADCKASRGPARPDGDDHDIARLFAHVEAYREAHITPVDTMPPLLTGDDLVARFGLKPGPQVGKLLAGLRAARIAGKVTDLPGAEEWVRDWLSQQDVRPENR